MPGPDPYQSDEAARLTRKALLILEKYRLRVQVLTLCGMRSAADFDILARNRWKYGVLILFQSEELRKHWEPGCPPVAERIQAVREARRGRNLHMGANPSQDLSGRVDRGG